MSYKIVKDYEHIENNLQIPIIYHIDAHRQAPGGIERITTSLESRYERWCVHFHKLSSDPGVWCLMIEYWHRPDEDKEVLSWNYSGQYLPLMVKCGDMQDYLSWLCQNVSMVEVDGRSFWINPSIKEGGG